MEFSCAYATPSYIVSGQSSPCYVPNLLLVMFSGNTEMRQGREKSWSILFLTTEDPICPEEVDCVPTECGKRAANCTTAQ